MAIIREILQIEDLSRELSFFISCVVRWSQNFTSCVEDFRQLPENPNLNILKLESEHSEQSENSNLNIANCLVDAWVKKSQSTQVNEEKI